MVRPGGTYQKVEGAGGGRDGQRCDERPGDLGRQGAPAQAAHAAGECSAAGEQQRDDVGHVPVTRSAVLQRDGTRGQEQPDASAPPGAPRVDLSGHLLHERQSEDQRQEEGAPPRSHGLTVVHERQVLAASHSRLVRTYGQSAWPTRREPVITGQGLSSGLTRRTRGGDARWPHVGTSRGPQRGLLTWHGQRPGPNLSL